MSVRREPPTGIKVIVAVGAVDGIWHALAGLVRILTGLLNPVALLVGALTLGIALGQLAVLYGLWTMEGWGWTWTVRILGFMAGLDVLALILGQGGLFRLALTVGILAYVYSQKSKYVRRAYA